MLFLIADLTKGYMREVYDMTCYYSERFGDYLSNRPVFDVDDDEIFCVLVSY